MLVSPLLLFFLYLFFSIFFSPFLSSLLFHFITLSCAVPLSSLLLHVLSQGTCSKLTRFIFRFCKRCLFLRPLSASCGSLSCFPFSVLFCADCISALPFHVLHTPCHPTPSFSCHPLISSCRFAPLSWPFCWLATYTSPYLASCFLSAFCECRSLSSSHLHTFLAARPRFSHSTLTPCISASLPLCLCALALIPYPQLLHCSAPLGCHL